MSENITFRTSLGGFNRSDVMNYIKDLIALKEESERKLGSLEEKIEEDRRVIADLNEKVKNAVDCDNCDLAKQNEVKIGAAMMDARRFSDLIVDEANEKSAKMYEAAAEDAYGSAEKAEELADKIKATAEEYAAAFNMLLTKMMALSTALGEFGNNVTGKKTEFESSFDENEKEEVSEEEPADNSGFAPGWKEPFAEGVFDPDFNFLDADSDYTIKIDMDD